MTIFFIIAIIIIIIIIIIDKTFLVQNKENKNNTTQELNLSKYTTKKYVMTQTELIFYRELKKITDELELTIFPQVDLERIIQVTDNNSADRNKIISRSIDYTIVNNKNCKIVACIELDDKSHNTPKAQKADNFKNELFNNVNIPLHRIKVNSFYNLEELKENLKIEKDK